MNTFNVIFSHLVLATLKYIFNTVKFTVYSLNVKQECNFFYYKNINYYCT